MVKNLNAGGERCPDRFDEQGMGQHADAELADAVASGVRLLEQLGAEVIEIQLPDLDEFLPAWPTLCSAEAVSAMKRPILPL